MTTPYSDAVARDLAAQHALEQARAEFDALVRRGEDTTNAAYELCRAIAVAEEARRQATAADVPEDRLPA